MRRRPDIEVTPGACISAAVMLMVLPLRWIFAALTAATIHELWHWVAIRICGGEVFALRIGASGAVMVTQPQTKWQELICAAAGPAGSFSLLLFARHFPATALCGFAQGMFNLLPLFPMDGGRILRCGLEMVFPRISERMLRWIELGIFLFAAAALTGIAFRLEMGVLSLILLSVAAVRLVPKKNTLQRNRTGGTIGTD